jgi:hypothetical protein
MGGCGSGYWERSGSRTTVEGCRWIDVSAWNRDGLLKPGTVFTTTWDRDGETVASIGVSVRLGAVLLSYRWSAHDYEYENVQQHVPIERTLCNFGGSRPWFICPGFQNYVHCGCRVVKLYSAGMLFACRSCHNLAYRSQNEHRSDRAARKARKIRMRLGGSPSFGEPFPQKPKWMHRRTYWRLEMEAEDAEAACWAGLAERFS